VAWCGERDYTYSGHTHKAAPLTPALQQLWPQVEQAAAARFNTVLLNYYRTGQDSMGWHADDEPELGRNPVIASLSLGAARRFKLRHNQTRAVVDIELPSGSLLVMAGALQHHWQHCLPKSARVTAPRLNLTFRWIG
jgi:alkylated DNA repair dioxygenase AlkB